MTDSTVPEPTDANVFQWTESPFTAEAVDLTDRDGRVVGTYDLTRTTGGLVSFTLPRDLPPGLYLFQDHRSTP